MERDKDNTMDEDIGDVKEEAAEGATGAAAAVVGSETGSGLATNVGGAIDFKITRQHWFQHSVHIHPIFAATFVMGAMRANQDNSRALLAQYLGLSHPLGKIQTRQVCVR